MFSFTGDLCASALSQQEQDTNLILATKANDIEAVKCLLQEKKADVNVVDPHGKTPFYWAFNFGHLELATFLEAKGTFLEAKGASKFRLL